MTGFVNFYFASFAIFLPSVELELDFSFRHFSTVNPAFPFPFHKRKVLVCHTYVTSQHQQNAYQMCLHAAAAAEKKTVGKSTETILKFQVCSMCRCWEAVGIKQEVFLLFSVRKHLFTFWTFFNSFWVAWEQLLGLRKIIFKKIEKSRDQGECTEVLQN